MPDCGIGEMITAALVSAGMEATVAATVASGLLTGVELGGAAGAISGGLKNGIGGALTGGLEGAALGGVTGGTVSYGAPIVGAALGVGDTIGGGLIGAGMGAGGAALTGSDIGTGAAIGGVGGAIQGNNLPSTPGSTTSGATSATGGVSGATPAPAGVGGDIQTYAEYPGQTTFTPSVDSGVSAANVTPAGNVGEGVSTGGDVGGFTAGGDTGGFSTGGQAPGSQGIQQGLQESFGSAPSAGGSKWDSAFSTAASSTGGDTGGATGGLFSSGGGGDSGAASSAVKSFLSGTPDTGATNIGQGPTAASASKLTASAAPAENSIMKAFDEPSFSNVGKALSSNAGLVAALGGLATDVIGGGASKEQSALTEQARKLNDTATQNMSYLSSGTLPAGAQAGITQATKAAIASIKSRYAAMGMSGSSAEQQEIQNAQMTAQVQGTNMAIQLMQSGATELQMSSQIYEEIMKGALSSDQAYSSAFTNLAGMMSGTRSAQ